MKPAPDIVKDYVPRIEEEQILAQVELVRRNRSTRAVLLHGHGGVGKTKLVRALPERSSVGDDVKWVPPIDLDDSHYWLLENLQRAIAKELGNDNAYFRAFVDLANLSTFGGAGRAGREIVASHNRKMRDSFVECYVRFVRATGSTVVITLDTVETVQNSYLLTSLMQMVRDLPRTLFVFSGRPTTGWAGKDTVQEYLDDPNEQIETTKLELSGFGHQDAMAFLNASALADPLSDDEKNRLVYLTAGQPLWLALAVDYLCRFGPPSELASSAESRLVRDRFRSELIAPYRSTEYWPDAIKRLAVLRHSVDQPAWERLMSDRGLPPGIKDWDAAWRELRAWPWIRVRANEKYVTLHDAFAEELATQVIPAHDANERWRRKLWRRAADEYAELIGNKPTEVRDELARIFENEPQPNSPTLKLVADLDRRKRELDQRRTAHLHYLLLCDFEKGTDQFDKQFSEATERDDLQFQELACHELQQFLPPARPKEPLRDAVGVVVDQFQEWLAEQPGRYLGLGLNIARFLIQNSQPEPALSLLSQLPEEGHGVNTTLKYRLANERGNACMRVPDEVERAAEQFREARDRARELPRPERQRVLAQAFNELGFYFRNIGKWSDADAQYAMALREIKDVAGENFPDSHREEMASIQTHWAYLKALQGHYDEASSLVREATRTRREIGREHGIGVSLSVSGEVQRYHRQFGAAWETYRQAEEIFDRLRNSSWLGLVLQEQAICLVQAHDAGEDLVAEPEKQAKLLIVRALDICRDQAARWYPSALNRAGRIFAREDPRQAIKYFDLAVEEARKIADGWFQCASLIEYLELSYRTWISSGDGYYRGLVDGQLREVREVIAKYPFKDFRGRWELLQGHLAVRDYLGGDGDRDRDLDAALEHYSTGFSVLAQGQIGSYGREAVLTEFAELGGLFIRLPDDVQATWRTQLSEDWQGGASLLTDELARLGRAPR